MMKDLIKFFDNISIHTDKREWYQEGYNDGYNDGLKEGLRVANKLIDEFMKENQEKMDRLLACNGEE